MHGSPTGPPMVENWVAQNISWLPELFWLVFKRHFFLVINTKFACFLFNHLSRVGSPIARLRGSCWIARPSNGSHLATGRPLIRSTGISNFIPHVTGHNKSIRVNERGPLLSLNMLVLSINYINPYCAEFTFRKYQNVMVISITSQNSDGSGDWNPSLWRAKTYLSYMNTVATDGLAPCVARTSVYP